MEINNFKAEFDEKLEKLIEEKIQKFGDNFYNPEIKKILTQFKKIALGGGKRFRPFATQIIYKNLGGKDNIDHILLAIELLHIFALIHDDIMDEGKVRHGQKTIHQLLFEQTNNKNYANSQAILVGDLVFQWAKEVFDKAKDIKYFSKAKKQFDILINEVIFGQMLDINLTQKNTVKTQEIIKKTEFKTARYTFANPILIGAILAGENEKNLEKLQDFGVNLGIAFQLQDDFLDINLTKQSGKNSMQDIQTGQKNLLSQYILTEKNGKFYKEFNSYFGKEIQIKKQKEKILEILNKSGAIDFNQKNIENYLNKAQNSILDLDKNLQKTCEKILKIVEKRKY